MVNELKIEIGGIISRVVPVDGGIHLKVDLPYKGFIIRDGEPDICLEVYRPPAPPLNFEEKIFHSRGLWSLYRSDGNYLIILRSPLPGSLPYGVAILEEDFRKGQLYFQPQNQYSIFDPQTWPLSSSSFLINPFKYPLDELLLINLCARRSGIIIHGCGISYDGRGVLFVGTSGAGKSTLANIWKGKRANLLSDDRIIVRWIENRFWMYGTPWHGDAGVCSPERVPLESIYLLRHGPENQIAPLPIVDAATRLLLCSFLPFYEKRGMENTLALLDHLVKKIPIYELRFVPNDTILSFMESHIHDGGSI